MSMTSRRRFLRKASFAAVTVAASPYYIAKGRAAANSKLQIGFVGTANRAAANLQGVAQETDSVAVTALCDVDRDYLEAARAKHPRAKTFRDFRELIARDDLDAVVVSTPDHTHAVACAAALRRGRHVYCEKPLTRTVSECRAVRDLARQHGVVTQMGTQIHAESNYRRVVELVQTGAIGPVNEVHVWCGAVYGGMKLPGDRPPVPSNLDWDLWLGPVPYRSYHPEYAPAKWRNWWAFGGGTMSDFGCHFMDLPHWALDLRYVTMVEPVDGPPPDPESVPRWMIARFHYPARLVRDRSLPPVQLTWYQGDKQPDLLSAEQRQYFRSGVLFVGAEGKLLADYTRHELLPEEKFAGFKPPQPFIPESVGHHREWVQAIRNGGATTCNFDYSGALAETVMLGNVAYRTGQRLVWDPRNLRAPNCPAAEQYIQHRYREGWRL